MIDILTTIDYSGGYSYRGELRLIRIGGSASGYNRLMGLGKATLILTKFVFFDRMEEWNKNVLMINRLDMI